VKLRRHGSRRAEWVPALLARWPYLFFRPRPTRALVEDAAAYPALAAEFTTLDKTLVPVFVRFDQEALVAQNAHRRLRLTIIGCALAAALLGVWKSSTEGATAVGVVEVCVSGLGAVLAWAMRKRHAHQRFLHARLTAELLRSEYFRFLARTDGYGGTDRESVLKARVEAMDTEAPP
jgi:Protein of unknown function (DUF4231)